MKKIIVAFIFIYNSAFSQNYMSKPFEKTIVRSQFNAELANRVLEERQRIYYNSQKPSCNSLIYTVVKNYQSSKSIIINNSSFLTAVYYIHYNFEGYVIAYIKEDEYDTKGKPYIFCGISDERWDTFVREANSLSSWGQSYQNYIYDYKCNCK
jgi:hypothetical protein